MSDVAFSVKVSVDGINSDVAESVVAHFQDETYYFGDTDLDLIHSDIQSHIDDLEDLPEEEKTNAEVLVELSEVFLDVGSSSFFTKADFEGKSFDEVAEMLENEEEHGEAYVIYVHETGGNVRDFEEAYVGRYDDNRAFAQELCESYHDMGELPDWVKENIDWEGVWMDLKYDYWEDRGYYFRNI